MTAGQLVDLWGTRYDAESALELGESAVGDACGELARRGIPVARAGAADAALASSDLVVAHGHGALDEDEWARQLRAAGQLAKKVLVVFAPNPRRVFAAGVPTERIAPILWELGRVREHLYLDVPAALEHAPEKVRQRVARSHAFVIDLTPRTPQERRRRLKQVS